MAAKTRSRPKMAEDSPRPARGRINPKFQCTARKKDGTRCRANRVKGQKVCSIHMPGGIEKLQAELKAKEAAGLAKRGSKPRPREIDLLVERLTLHADEIINELLEIALNAMKPVVVSGTKDEPGYVTMVPDHDVRLKAVKELYDRVHGRPAQSLKVGGDGSGEPIAVDVPKSKDRAAAVAEILNRQGAIRRQAGSPHGGRRRTNGQAANGSSAAKHKGTEV